MIKGYMRWLLSLLFLFPSLVFGQSVASDFLGTQSSLVFFPSYPNPQQEFTVSLDDYSGGAFGASIDWVINGERQADKQNNRSLTITSSEAGKPMQIEAILTLANGSTQRLSRTITPRFLDIIFEPQTHVPGFYRGRPLPSQGSQVNATALLHNINQSPSNLIYTWRVGNKVVNGGPLLGQNKISFTVPMGREIPVTVEVANANGEILARRIINLPSVSPEIIFYEVNTLFGIKPISLSSLLLMGNSATVRAVPYHLDSRVYNQPDVILWEIDNTEYATGFGNPYEITIERGATAGNSRLEFRVTDTTNFLQGARAELLLNY